jgi:glutamine amidotransferase
MCRSRAYRGSPILIEEALYLPAHLLIDQHLHYTLAAEAANSDGFGIGWYDDKPEPALTRSWQPTCERRRR